MALVAHTRLPAFQSMRQEGARVVTPDEAIQAELPHLRVGLLNLMPDAALRATDRQFIRLVAAYGDSADVWVYPFTVAAEHRGEAARLHISEHYSTFEEVVDMGLDALIVTGANPAQDDLAREVFWEGMIEVLDWAEETLNGVLCSCLATHAVLKKGAKVERFRLPQKRWGVYSHRLLVDDHPLVMGLQPPVEAPHSHWYDVTREQLEPVGVRVLMESDEAGVHMAVSEDDFYLFFQGHPEYDLVSLLKEYKREVGRFFRGERNDYPPYPEHYFDERGKAELELYRQRLINEKYRRHQIPTLPERLVTPQGRNTWTEPGYAIYRNWLGQIRERKYGADVPLLAQG